MSRFPELERASFGDNIKELKGGKYLLGKKDIAFMRKMMGSSTKARFTPPECGLSQIAGPDSLTVEGSIIWELQYFSGGDKGDKIVINAVELPEGEKRDTMSTACSHITATGAEPEILGAPPEDKYIPDISGTKIFARRDLYTTPSTGVKVWVYNYRIGLDERHYLAMIVSKPDALAAWRSGFAMPDPRPGFPILKKAYGIITHT